MGGYELQLAGHYLCLVAQGGGGEPRPSSYPRGRNHHAPLGKLDGGKAYHTEQVDLLVLPGNTPCKLLGALFDKRSEMEEPRVVVSGGERLMGRMVKARMAREQRNLGRKNEYYFHVLQAFLAVQPCFPVVLWMQNLGDQ